MHYYWGFFNIHWDQWYFKGKKWGKEVEISRKLELDKRATHKGLYFLPFNGITIEKNAEITIEKEYHTQEAKYRALFFTVQNTVLRSRCVQKYG